MVRLSSLGVYGAHHSFPLLHSQAIITKIYIYFFFVGGELKSEKKAKEATTFIPWNPPLPRGSESINVSYPPTVERGSTTVKKHEAHTRQTQSGGKKNKEESRERKRFNSQDTEHSTKREAVNTTTTTITIMMRNDTLFLSRRQYIHIADTSNWLL